jgi:hypothetical protein
MRTMSMSAAKKAIKKRRLKAAHKRALRTKKSKAATRRAALKKEQASVPAS